MNFDSSQYNSHKRYVFASEVITHLATLGNSFTYCPNREYVIKIGFAGFKQPIAACCGYGGLPLNFDNRIACGVTKILNGSSVTAHPCKETAEYVNWDGNHYTEAANSYISSQILTGNYSHRLLLANEEFVCRPKLC